jgi:hypothetical protein
MKITEYAVAMEKSGRPGDLAVARFLRENERKLRRYLRRAGNGLDKEDRDELAQVAMLAVVQAVHGTEDVGQALRAVDAALAREKRAAVGWRDRKFPALPEWYGDGDDGEVTADADRARTGVEPGR